jgi:diguanylate cyclase (GGDEF)-like protein
VGAHPWRILFCGSVADCGSIARFAEHAKLPVDLTVFSESGSPASVIRTARGTERRFEAVIANHAWIAANNLDVVPSVLQADDGLCLIIQAARIDQPSDCIISDRVMAVPDDHLGALTLAVALAQKCRVERLYADTRAAIESTNRAARLVSSEFQRQQRGQEEKLNVQNEQFETALNNMPQGVCMFDANAQLVVCNDRYIEMYEISRDIVRPGVSLRAIVRHRHDTGSFAGDVDEYCLEVMTAIARDKVHTKIMQTPDGRTISIVDRAMAKGGWVATHEDITERSRAEAKIKHMARHDILTGLSNRAALEDQMQEALERVRRGGRVAVMCLDLDHFKNINDTLGHPVGDKLLCAVTERLNALVRAGDTVARMGGDEFVILQTGIERPEDAESLAQRLVTSIDRPFDLAGHQFVVSTSVGIALAPRDGTTSEELLRNADLALYSAKSDGRATYRFFEPKMNKLLQDRRQLEADLRNALVHDELELYYQPQVDAMSEEITGCEALLRWNHPVRGLVMPFEFIPLAEEIGLIVPIGEWVLRKACQEAKSWPKPYRIAVNLSPAQFRSRDLVQSVLDALAETNLEPHRLELEITETTLLRDDETTMATLQRLHDLGIKISMDDFGTGYASLSNLHRFPFDKIKIDRSFVVGMEGKGDGAAIIKAVVWLGKELGITTVAEGVETDEQLQQVRAYGCSEVQGYLFSRPLPVSALRKYIERRGVDSRAA